MNLNVKGHFELKNGIYIFSLKEANLIKNYWLQNPKIYIAELQGKEIQSWSDYINAIESAFQFPTKIDNNMDAYNDYMRDLDWLNKDGYMLFFYDFKGFISKDFVLKEKIIQRFKDTILPFWQEEITFVVVEGKAKPFNVYIVD